MTERGGRTDDTQLRAEHTLQTDVVSHLDRTAASLGHSSGAQTFTRLAFLDPQQLAVLCPKGDRRR